MIQILRGIFKSKDRDSCMNNTSYDDLLGSDIDQASTDHHHDSITKQIISNPGNSNSSGHIDVNGIDNGNGIVHDTDNDSKTKQRASVSSVTSCVESSSRSGVEQIVLLYGVVRLYSCGK